MNQATRHPESLKCWTVEDYHRMIAAGILTPADRVELLNGQIIEMVPQDPSHAANTSSFGNQLVVKLADRAWIRTQLPLTLTPDSEPEPDIAIVHIDTKLYRDRHPSPTDVFWLIEIANTTLRRDRTLKAPLYAQAGIPEYWIVDLTQQQVIVQTQPQGDRYRSIQVFSRTEQIVPSAFPDVVVELRSLLI